MIDEPKLMQTFKALSELSRETDEADAPSSLEATLGADKFAQMKGFIQALFGVRVGVGVGVENDYREGEKTICGRCHRPLKDD